MPKQTILVIEDEEKLRRVVGLHLAAAGYDVKAVGTAEEGFKLAGDAGLILTDLKLPGMDGLDLLEKLIELLLVGRNRIPLLNATNQPA